MKKFFSIIVLTVLTLMLPICAHAYNIINLPASMTLSDALGIFNSSEITSVTVSDFQDGKYTVLDKGDIDELYNMISDLKVTRSINPTPFRGIAVNFYTTDGEVKTYCINSGVQVGLYGQSNYICYKLSDSDTEKILYLQSQYYDDEAKAGGETLHRDTSKNFLKMPQAQWARNFVTEAAAKSLLPYEFTDIYPNNISREQFCILLGNLIAVKEGYHTIADYMESTGNAYLKNYFEDCNNVDDSVNILYALGIVNGKDETHFDPEGELTREQAATLLCRAAERYTFLETETELRYTDAWLISDWARFYVTWANENGIMTGITDTDFVPQGAYTVEQAIATMVRLFNSINI